VCIFPLSAPGLRRNIELPPLEREKVHRRPGIRKIYRFNEPARLIFRPENRTRSTIRVNAVAWPAAARNGYICAEPDHCGGMDHRCDASIEDDRGT
jgi:hypothetical protein